jgi:uncharacterized protein YodC (DUF2158 family)
MLNKNDFKIGDVVKLNSGGPHMTINYIRGNGDIDCVYSTIKEKIKPIKELDPNTLTKIR